MFYVLDLKKTYISLDAAFDEGFTSPMNLPDLPFGGAIRLRAIQNRRIIDNEDVEQVGKSVTEE